MKSPNGIVLINMYEISGPNERDCFCHYLQDQIAKHVNEEISKHGGISTEFIYIVRV